MLSSDPWFWVMTTVSIVALIVMPVFLGSVVITFFRLWSKIVSGDLSDPDEIVEMVKSASPFQDEDNME